MSGSGMPEDVYTLWLATVLLAVVVFVPLAIYSLYGLWRAARSIQLYARDAVEPARAIAAHTSALPALDGTIAVATDILAAATAVAEKLDAIATVLEARASRLR